MTARPHADAGATAPRAARARTLALTDFRNVARTELSPADAGIAVIGDNGQGKTNLLEAISYLALFRSMRGARDRDLVRFGAPAFHVAATLDGVRAASVGVGVDRAGNKRVQLDGVESPRLADAIGALPSVCFSPSDVALVAGGPGERRRYLDIALALSTPGYLAALRGYRAALARRNAVLRSRRVDRAAVRAWQPALAMHGGVLVAARSAWVADFAARFEALAAAAGEGEALTMRYDSAFAGADAPSDEIAAALDASLDGDVARGMTQAGPHRDDLAVQLGGHPLRTTGSAGQQRTAAIVLRLVEAETIRSRTGTQPLILLDDPFAELDRTRSACLLALLDDVTLGGAGQVFLCVPREDDIPLAFDRLARWRVRGGVFTREMARG